MDEATILGMPRKEWRTFNEAREFARSLELKGKIEWYEYAKSGDVMKERELYGDGWFLTST